MSFWKIAWRNIEQRALASSLTGLSMALGVMLMILVIVIHSVAVEQFENDAEGYNLIVGGKAGKMQMVLTTVYHLEKPIAPIAWDYYKLFVDDGKFAYCTDVAVPYCLGDTFHRNGWSFRVVATSPDLFDKLSYGVDEDLNEKKYKFAEGRNFKAENFFEAVVGSRVARKTGLKVGDRIRPTHGMSSAGSKHLDFEIVGILEHTGTANDRALFANIEGFFLLDKHALTLKDPETGEPLPRTVPTEQEILDGAEPVALPEAQREVTSILVRCSDEHPYGPMQIEDYINKGEERVAQVVAPIEVVSRLLDTFVRPARVVLMVLAVLVVIVSGISILVSIYNSMSERSYDIAVMRALGASRNAVMGIILFESILLSLLGGIAGVFLGHVVLAIAAPWVESMSGVILRFWEFHWQEALLIPGLLAFASLVGFLPALTAYRTDVAKTLGGAR